jgi:hypothetical protein
MEKKRSKKYELRFEVASERNKIPGYTLIPMHDRSAEAQHMTEHEALQVIQRDALRGDIEAVKRQLLEFPEYKREDLKKMLKSKVLQHMEEFWNCKKPFSFDSRFRESNNLLFE